MKTGSPDGRPVKIGHEAARSTARKMLAKSLGFDACKPSTLDSLVIAGRLRTLRKSEVLVNRGDMFDVLCVLLVGSIEVRILLESGKRYLIHFLQPGDLAGIMSCSDGEPHSTDLVARVNDTAVLLIPCDTVRACSREDPGLPQAFVCQLAFRSRELYERLLAGSSMEVHEKLARLIIRLAKEYGVDVPGGRLLTFKASQADFADLLGATRQSINLALQQFKNEGLIGISYSSLTVIDFPRMCEYAGAEPDNEMAGKPSQPLG
jgi:CRP/FNR family transcriptional regulator